MQKKRAALLRDDWGGRPCAHPALGREYDLGKRTGNYVCTQCGAVLTFREKAELFGVRTPDAGTDAGIGASHSGGYMGRKSSREIPDFSRKASRPKGKGVPNTVPAAMPKAVAAVAPRPKPQSSSAKSGQRGK